MSPQVLVPSGPAPRVDVAVCTSCGLCLLVCPSGAVTVGYGPEGTWHPALDERRCIRCDDCERVCPEHAVEIPYQVVLEERSLP